MKLRKKQKILKTLRKIYGQYHIPVKIVATGVPGDIALIADKILKKLTVPSKKYPGISLG